MYKIDNEKEVEKLLSLSPQERRKKAHAFNRYLNSEPPGDMIRTNKYAPAVKGKKPEYLEIGYICWLLDLFFIGNWTTKNFKWEFQYGSVVGTVELEYWHPVFEKYITRVGASGQDIKINKDTGGISGKALETLPGALKSECIKNAAKDIGNAFGRNLNRNFKQGYYEHSELDGLL